MFYDKPVLDVVATDDFIYEFVATTDRTSGTDKVLIRWTNMAGDRVGVIGGMWDSVDHAKAFLAKPVSLPVP